MYQIRIHGIFESAHYLYNYHPDGSDENIHGHTWECEVFVNSPRLENGMSLDFLEIRKTFDQIMTILDHQCINELPPFNKLNPTAENLANWIATKLMPAIPTESVLHEIRVWEGPKNYASYFPLTGA